MSLSLDLDLARPGFRLTLRQTLPLTGLTAVFGPSGAGKSTLLRVIAGFERTGARIAFGPQIWEDGRHFVPPHRRRVGFVFQDPRLFAHLDVRANLAYGARRAGRLGDLAAVAERYDLTRLLDRRTDSLSGGEAQRVALARAVLADPQLLVMDEPLSALDQARRAEVLPHIEHLRDEARLPILYVSHSLAEVVRLSTDVLALADGQVVAFGPTAAVLSDRAAAAAFGGEEPGSLIEARVAGHDPDGLCRLEFDGGTILVPGPLPPPGAAVRLLVRARDVIVARDRPTAISALNVIDAKIDALTEAGPAAADVQLSCGATRVRARITRRSAGELGLVPGTRCYAILKSVALAQD